MSAKKQKSGTLKDLTFQLLYILISHMSDAWNANFS
jgi:hypothetical protein